MTLNPIHDTNFNDKATNSTSATTHFLPTECIQKIFAYLYEDIPSLHSGVLVCRHWCRSIVPILWRQTLHLELSKTNPRIIPAYLPFLTEESLASCGIIRRQKNNNKKQQPFFDYPCYLRQMDYSILYECICACENADKRPICRRRADAEDEGANEAYGKALLAKELCKLFVSSCKSFGCLHLETLPLKEQMEKALFRIPVEFLSIPDFPGASECLANLAAFECSGDYDKQQIFTGMASICKDLKILTADGIDYGKDASSALATLLSKQRGLEYFLLSRCLSDPSRILSALKSSELTLKSLQFSSCHFPNDDSLKPISSCVHIDTLRMNQCGFLTDEMFASIKNTTFPNLAYLDFTYTFAPTYSFIEVFRRSHSSLREICLGGIHEHSPDIVSGVAEYCHNVTVFEVTVQRDGIHKLPMLLRNCHQLEVVRLYGDLNSWTGFLNASDMIGEVGDIVPLKMREMVIVTNWAVSAAGLSKFFQKCRAFLSNMTVHCFDHTLDIKPYTDAITEYVKRHGMDVKCLSCRLEDRLLEFTYRSTSPDDHR
ncbi:11309_t:CDS:2 [Paraglomus occultum]|uniref:11309_t:CDS:1 n=1 Tax=Paraglomus occultum TaxID=144539 RepID=A0A9N8W479_9GLOM|nr:11309_t:CDS:2 [Paraglomus occultum]